MRTDDEGFIVKYDMPLMFCFDCCKFNRRTRACTAKDRGPYICIWTIETAYSWACDKVTAGEFKKNYIAEAIKKGG